MIRAEHLRRFDWVLLACYLALCGVGLLFIWSAGARLEAGGIVYDARFLVRQMRWFLVSVLAMLGVLFFDYEACRRHAVLLYGAGLFLLAAVLAVGPEIKGAQRWLVIRGYYVQPSEFVKIAVVLALARHLMYRRDRRRFAGLFVPLALVFVPMGLILAEPDLGTACVLLPALFAMLYAWGARGRHLGLLAGAGVAAAPLLWFLVMSDAQKRRVLSFLAPEADARGGGFQIIQSIIAIGSGGLTGKGIPRGSQHLLRLVPEEHTDFIFAVIAEELGLVGGLMILVLFFILFSRCVEIAAATREPFGRLVVVGGAAILAFQVLVNIGMTMRLCPVTGLTLPFISYGGSSLVSSSLIIALILNVGMRRKQVVAPDDFRT